MGEVPHPGVHRRELRFEIGDRLTDVRRRFPEFALVLALDCRLQPARSSSPQETQPAAKVTVAHVKAVV